MLDNFVGASGFDHGDHEGLGGQWDDNGAGETERARCVYRCKASVAAAGREDVW
jgi:hypothetical protein